MIEGMAAGFVLGVASSAHCAGMCGVFAAQAASAAGGWRAAARTALYTCGKAFTYVFLGALAGWIGGRALEVASGAQVALGLATGVVLVVAGTAMLRGSGTPTGGATLARIVRPLVTSLRRADAVGGPFALGAASGFLPCGVVYLAALQASALGGAAEGAASMAAFGVGTAPVLLAVGVAGRSLLDRLGPRRVQLAGGVLVVLAGALGAARALLPLVTAEGGGAACCH